MTEGAGISDGDGRLYDVLLLPLVRRGEVEVLRYDRAPSLQAQPGASRPKIAVLHGRTDF